MMVVSRETNKAMLLRYHETLLQPQVCQMPAELAKIVEFIFGSFWLFFAVSAPIYRVVRKIDGKVWGL